MTVPELHHTIQVCSTNPKFSGDLADPVGCRGFVTRQGTSNSSAKVTDYIKTSMPSHSKLDGGDEVGRGSGLPSPAFGNDNPTAASTSRAEQKLPSLLPTSSAGKKEANRAGSGAWPSVTAGLFKQQELQSPKVKQDTKAQSEEKKKKSDREREGMFSLSDSQLQARWSFVEKINGGNWGTIWTCYQRNQKSTTTKTEGLMPFSASGFPFSQKMVDSNTKLFAVKLCRKDKTPEGSQRIRGLWNEFKVILTIVRKKHAEAIQERTCSSNGGARDRGIQIEWHSGIVRFLEFVMTPSMALLFMPYYPQQMTINLPEEVCRKYFQHLLSAIFWLHQNNVTHNDIKISNIVVSLEGDSWVPVLIDFGFATVHDLSKPNAFYSDQQWGTPEYLAPERAGGSLHDERKSDLWSLGVTFFEMATGRTPFESVDEPISTEEEIERYYQRTLTGRWIGEWELPDMMEDLIAGILKPVPEERIGFADAILHPFFDPISTADENAIRSSYDDSLEELMMRDIEDEFCSDSETEAERVPTLAQEKEESEGKGSEMPVTRPSIEGPQHPSRPEKGATRDAPRIPTSPSLSMACKASNFTNLVTGTPPWDRSFFLQLPEIPDDRSTNASPCKMVDAKPSPRSNLGAVKVKTPENGRRLEGKIFHGHPLAQPFPPQSPALLQGRKTPYARVKQGSEIKNDFSPLFSSNGSPRSRYAVSPVKGPSLFILKNELASHARVKALKGSKSVQELEDKRMELDAVRERSLAFVSPLKSRLSKPPSSIAPPPVPHSASSEVPKVPTTPTRSSRILTQSNLTWTGEGSPPPMIPCSISPDPRGKKKNTITPSIADFNRSSIKALFSTKRRDQDSNSVVANLKKKFDRNVTPPGDSPRPCGKSHHGRQGISSPLSGRVASFTEEEAEAILGPASVSPSNPVSPSYILAEVVEAERGESEVGRGSQSKNAHPKDIEETIMPDLKVMEEKTMCDSSSVGQGRSRFSSSASEISSRPILIASDSNGKCRESECDDNRTKRCEVEPGSSLYSVQVSNSSSSSSWPGMDQTCPSDRGEGEGLIRIRISDDGDLSAGTESEDYAELRERTRCPFGKSAPEDFSGKEGKERKVRRERPISASLGIPTPPSEPISVERKAGARIVVGTSQSDAKGGVKATSACYRSSPRSSRLSLTPGTLEGPSLASEMVEFIHRDAKLEGGDEVTEAVAKETRLSKKFAEKPRGHVRSSSEYHPRSLNLLEEKIPREVLETERVDKEKKMVERLEKMKKMAEELAAMLEDTRNHLCKESAVGAHRMGEKDNVACRDEKIEQSEQGDRDEEINRCSSENGKGKQGAQTESIVGRGTISNLSRNIRIRDVEKENRMEKEILTDDMEILLESRMNGDPDQGCRKTAKYERGEAFMALGKPAAAHFAKVSSPSLLLSGRLETSGERSACMLQENGTEPSSTTPPRPGEKVESAFASYLSFSTFSNRPKTGKKFQGAPSMSSSPSTETTSTIRTLPISNMMISVSDVGVSDEVAKPTSMGKGLSKKNSFFNKGLGVASNLSFSFGMSLGSGVAGGVDGKHRCFDETSPRPQESREGLDRFESRSPKMKRSPSSRQVLSTFPFSSLRKRRANLNGLGKDAEGDTDSGLGHGRQSSLDHSHLIRLGFKGDARGGCQAVWQKGEITPKMGPVEKGPFSPLNHANCRNNLDIAPIDYHRKAEQDESTGDAGDARFLNRFQKGRAQPPDTEPVNRGLRRTKTEREHARTRSDLEFINRTVFHVVNRKTGEAGLKVGGGGDSGKVRLEVEPTRDDFHRSNPRSVKVRMESNQPPPLPLPPRPFAWTPSNQPSARRKTESSKDRKQDGRNIENASSNLQSPSASLGNLWRLLRGKEGAF